MKRSILRSLTALALTLCLSALSFFTPAALAAGPGDIDGNGDVTSADARLALRAAVGLETYKKGSAKFTAADVTGDGLIASDDARLILRVAVGLDMFGAPATNAEYDTLRSGTYYLKGYMIENGNQVPFAVGIDSNTIYLEAAADGLSMGYMLKKGSTYLLNIDKKTYCKLSALEAAALKSAGLMTENELRETVENMGFSSFLPLSKANAVTRAKLDGTDCLIYTFDGTDGSRIRVYTSGSRLLALENVNPKGQTVTMMRVEKVSKTLPQLPPSDYRSKNLLAFVSEMQ